MTITVDRLKHDPAVQSYIRRADESLSALGYTEHSFPHVTRVSETAKRILTTLGYSTREVELAEIAGYLHDIGNVINRVDHAQSGAIMAFRLLDKMEMPPEEIATVITAIGNHDEETAFPVNPVAAALILADKTDVRESRVRKGHETDPDIHDRVNFSVKRSEVSVDTEEVLLDLTIDTDFCPVMDYFEIFLGRMNLCREAAAVLGVRFSLVINGQRMV
jgi:metal-dependent HD superfamily phosphatase/phosphodiesterase